VSLASFKDQRYEEALREAFIRMDELLFRKETHEEMKIYLENVQFLEPTGDGP